MSGDELVLGPGAFLMVHKPYVALARGNADQLLDTAGTLRQLERRYIRAYSEKSGLDQAAVETLLEGNGSYLTAERAVALGLADRIDETRKSKYRIRASQPLEGCPPALAAKLDRTPARKTNPKIELLRKRLARGGK